MSELRESLLQVVKFGPVYQLDGINPYTGSLGTIKVHKNGVAAAARNSGTAITHDTEGYHFVTLDSTDTNTRGILKISATNVASFIPAWEKYMVLAGPYYDEKYGAPVALAGAAAGSATLDAGASAIDDFYKDDFITTTGGTGVGQTRRIVSYNGTTKVAILDRNWATGATPVAGTNYRLISNSTVSLSNAERDAIAAAYLGLANGIETGITPKQADRIMLAALGGKSSGASAGAGTVKYRNPIVDNKDRITSNYDAFGNRLTTTFDLTD